jgi:hypothetical protein
VTNYRIPLLGVDGKIDADDLPAIPALVPAWQASTDNLTGQLVNFNGIMYRRNADGNSGSGAFDLVNWSKSGLPRFVQAVTDVARSNTTVLADDPELTLPLAQNAVYKLDAFLIFEASQVSDIAMKFTTPAGCTMQWTTNGLQAAATTAAASINRAPQTLAGSAIVGCAGIGTPAVALPTGILLTGSTGGNLAVQWAQNFADPTNATRRAGSSLMLTRIS